MNAPEPEPEHEPEADVRRRRGDAEGGDDAAEGGASVAATPEMCHLCFDALLAELAPDAAPPACRAGAGDAVPPAVECPLFVTWSKRRRARRPPAPSAPAAAAGDEYELRGCIGTLAPRPLGPALADLAAAAGLRDRRFAPIAPREVARLRAGVSLLVGHEACRDWADWDVGVHGIAIAFEGPGGRAYAATYLPEVAREQGWSRREAVASLVAKAGYRGAATNGLLAGIRVTRYRSSKCQVTYQEYVASRFGEDPSAAAGGTRPPRARAATPCVPF